MTQLITLSKLLLVGEGLRRVCWMLSYVKMEQSPEIEETLYCECDCEDNSWQECAAFNKILLHFLEGH